MPLNQVDISLMQDIPAPGVAGKVLSSDGTNWINADGASLPATGADGNVLTSDGTNWASETPADTTDASSLTTGTLNSARLDTGTTANKILQLDGNGKIPAVDASLLTNIPSDITKTTSDPALDANPAGGVGTLHLNKNTGNLYCLTDATTDTNVWTNIGTGSENVEPFAYGGETAGYVHGGSNIPNPYMTSQYNITDRTSFASDGASTDTGDLTVARAAQSGASSATYGYCAGGYTGQNSNQGYTVVGNITIDRFQFAAGGNSTDVGDLPLQFQNGGGHHTATHGYRSAGEYHPSPHTHNYEDTVHKYSFATGGNANVICDVSTPRTGVAASNDGTHGYVAGGYYSSYMNNIDRFNFATEATGTDVGDLAYSMQGCIGTASSQNGYVLSGTTGSNTNYIQKYAYASSGNGSDIANLLDTTNAMGSLSSKTYGYATGGYAGETNRVQKHAFASDSDATDVGDLTQARYDMGNGTHY